MIETEIYQNSGQTNMTREIKFRAWDKDAGLMLDSWQLSIHDDKVFVQRIKGGDGEPTDVDLMQFTGLLDKNGKEIYEGDIIRTLQGGLGDHTHKNFLVEWKNDSAYKQRVAYFEPFANFWINMLTTEVIGNIYQNSELLHV